VHLIRNAGGIVTDDVLRSLALSQRKLGTREVLVVHHTDCGLHGLDDEALADEVEAETGERPPFAFGGFDDLDASVRASVARAAAVGALAGPAPASAWATTWQGWTTSTPAAARRSAQPGLAEATTGAPLRAMAASFRSRTAPASSGSTTA